MKKNNPSLCKSHIIELDRISERLDSCQKMDTTQLILSPINISRIEKAKRHIWEAINLLEEVK